MTSVGLRLVDGAEAGAWIEPALQGGFGASVGQQVPLVYDAYARVFHPVYDVSEGPVSWAEVARRFGRVAHREMQWQAIIGDPEPDVSGDSAWDGWEPAIGQLEEAPLRALCAILAGNTATADRCLFGLSTIFGDVTFTFPGQPLLQLPGRDFVVLAGPLTAADQILVDDFEAPIFALGLVARVARRLGYMTRSHRAWLLNPDPPPRSGLPPNARAPSLIWPADHAWYVASEYEFDSTLVGGSRDLVDAVLASPELEAWEVYPEDSLNLYADTLNLPSD